MRKAVPTLAVLVLLAGCGGGSKPAPTATATASAAADKSLAGYSAGVRKYYTGAKPEAADDPNADAEERYFQPPRPAQVNLGETITLTGSNIGVQLGATATAIKTVRAGGKEYTAIELELDNDKGGITVYDGELKSAALTYAGGRPQPVVQGVQASCSNTFEGHVRIDVSAKRKGCLLFPASEGEAQQLQLALETVPTEAGGIWNLNAR
jgi:hypothetical protein